MTTSSPLEIAPDDCPEPGWHQTHRYCPICTWREPQAPLPSPIEIARNYTAPDRQGTAMAQALVEINEVIRLRPDQRRHTLGVEIEAILDGSVAPQERTVSAIPRDFWREVPCGHPPDPVAARDGDDRAVCHCGLFLDGLRPFREVIVDGVSLPLVFCNECGCHIAIPPTKATA